MAIAAWTLTWYALFVFFSEKSDLLYLNFVTKKPHFSLAQVEWNGLILNQPTSQDQTIVDLSQEDPNDLVTDLFGSLNFVEMFKLWQKSQNHPAFFKSLNWELLFQHNQMHWSASSLELFECLNKLDSSFLDWAEDKKLSAQDLAPLKALKDFSPFNLLAENFSLKQLSRNDGKKVIDLLVDLILMSKPIEELTPQNKNWLDQLLCLRNPMTIKRDQSSSLDDSWPRYVQVSRQRTGDRLVHKMQIQFSDDQDLKDKLARLNSKALEQ